MGAVAEKSFTTSLGTTWSSYESIDLPRTGRNHAVQVVSVSAIANASAGSAVLTFILYDNGDTTTPVKRRYDCTITSAATTRGGPDGTSSGHYLCTAVFAASSNQNQDIMPGDPPEGMEWKWGLSALTTLTDVKVILAFDEVI